MDKKECKKLINEILKELDDRIDVDIEHLNRNGDSKRSASILFKFSYDVIKSHLETIRDIKLDNILNKINNKGD